MGNLAASLKYLKDNRVKKGDSVESAARSERMNALTDAILSIARGEHVRKGPGIRLKTSEGVLTISATAEDGDGGGGEESDFPFRVTAATKDNYTAIQVVTGLVMNQVPYIDGELMNQLVMDSSGNLVTNTLTPPTDDFSLWLITRIKNVFDNYHPRIDIALPGESYIPVFPPDQSCYITHVAPDLADQIDFKIKWDGPESLTGWFPIKLADVTVTPAAPGETTGPVVTSVTQYVYTNFRSMILVGDYVVPVSN